MNIVTKKLSLIFYIQFLFYSLVAVTPLLMSSATSEIFEFNKMLFIYFITILISVLYGLNIVIKKQRVVSSFFFVILLIFLTTQILSATYSIDPHTSIFGYYGRWNGGVLSIVSYILLVFIFVQTFTVSKVKMLLRISLISSLIVILWGHLARLGLDFSCLVFTGDISNDCWTAQFNPANRMFSTIGQPNWLGAYIAFHFFVGLYFLLKNLVPITWDLKAIIPKLFKKSVIIYFAYLVLALLAIIYTGSRSSLLAVIIALAVGGIILGGKMLKLKKRSEEIAIVVFALGVFAAFFIGWKTGYIQNFFGLPTEATTITDSFDIRKVVWKGAIDLGFQYPLFGTGVETFAYSYYFARPLAHNLTSEWDFIYNKAHNEYLNYFATTGFIGLSAYLLVIISVFILFWRYFHANKEKLKVEDESILVISLMLGYITILITNFFGFSVSTIQILFYLTPAFVIALLSKDKEVMLHSFKNLDALKKVAASALLVLGLTSLYFLFNYYTADTAYAKAKVKMDSNDYQEALILLDTARRKKYEHVYEDKMSYALANIAFLYSFDDKEKAQTYVRLADVANIRTLQQAPENMLYWRTRGKDYYLFYQISHDDADLQKALDAFEEMVRIAPTDAQSYYTLALFYWISSNEVLDSQKKSLYLNRAKEEISTTLRMRPTYVEAQELSGEIDAALEE